MPNYSTEELIRYVYHETNKRKTLAIETAIKEDWSLREKLDALKVSMQQLDEIIVSPREQVCFSHSKLRKVYFCSRTTLTGLIFFLMNPYLWL